MVLVMHDSELGFLIFLHSGLATLGRWFKSLQINCFEAAHLQSIDLRELRPCALATPLGQVLPVTEHRKVLEASRGAVDAVELWVSSRHHWVLLWDVRHWSLLSRGYLFFFIASRSLCFPILPTKVHINVRIMSALDLRVLALPVSSSIIEPAD